MQFIVGSFHVPIFACFRSEGPSASATSVLFIYIYIHITTPIYIYIYIYIHTGFCFRFLCSSLFNHYDHLVLFLVRAPSRRLGTAMIVLFICMFIVIGCPVSLVLFKHYYYHYYYYHYYCLIALFIVRAPSRRLGLKLYVSIYIYIIISYYVMLSYYRIFKHI